MTDLAQPDPAIEDLQEHIDHYDADRAVTPEDPVEWYMRCQAEIAIEEAGVKGRFKKHREILDAAEKGLLGDLARRRGGLEWKHKQEVISIVAERLKGQKSRHVKTDHGMAGFRKQRETQRMVITDEQGIIDRCPGLTRQMLQVDKELLRAELEAGTRIPEAHLATTPEQDNFYIDTGKPKELPAAQSALPEQKGSD